MKKTKYTVVIIISALALLCTVVQIQFERYITQQNEQYDLLKDKRRVSYMPVVIYFAKNILGTKNPLDGEITDCVYRNAASGKLIITEGTKDEYMINCYFDQSEKEWEKDHCEMKIDTVKTPVNDKIIYTIPR